MEVNAKAARLRKGTRNGTKTHCINGHTLTDARVYYQYGYIKRDCRTCWKLRGQRGGLMKPEALVKVKAALSSGATIGQIIHGRPVGGGKADPALRMIDAGILSRYRRENPEFDRFIEEVTAGNNRRGQKIRRARAQARLLTAARRDEANDYQKILALFPANFPGRDDAAHDLFLAMFEGALQREDMKGRVKQFIAAHYRMFPTKFAKFGNSPLVSLDEVLFEDGTATRGDMVSRGLWD